MSDPDLLDAEIEYVETMLRHAGLLTHAKDPRKKIVAAKGQLALQMQLETLRREREERDVLPMAAEQPAGASH